MMALEFLFFYLFGEGKENWQHLSNIVRVAPGMADFSIYRIFPVFADPIVIYA